MKTFIGIDPGGVKAFGWCVMDATLPALSVGRIVTGACSGISEAIPEIERICETQPVGAGIDAPLYWARVVTGLTGLNCNWGSDQANHLIYL